MPYSLNNKLLNLKPYDPIEGSYKIRLDANESYIDCNKIMAEKIAESIKNIELNRYPDPYANNVAKAFAELYNIDKENVTAGNGSDELISIITSCFLEKGDNVLTLSPDFSMYAFYGNLYELNVHTLNKDENLEISVDEIIEYCNLNNIKALIFSNPCNPTSLGILKKDVIKLVSEVKALVILDEAYMDFWTESMLDMINDYDNLIILKTCSKAIGLAGIRLGFAVAGKTITTALKAAKSPYNTDSVSQAIGECVLSQKDFIQKNISELIENRNYFYEKIIELSDGYKCFEKIYNTCTNFIFIKTDKANEIFNKLAEKSIVVRNFGSYLRITAGSKSETNELLENLKEIINNF